MGLTMMKLFLIVAMLILLGCASGPYAILDGSSPNRADPDQYEVLILGVDGRLYPNGRREHRVDPGFHYMELATTKPDRRGGVTRMPFAINAKACTRYYVAAVHERELDSRGWHAKTVKEAPIPGCVVTEGDPK